MANDSSGRRKPRIRKAAPTVREQVEASKQSENEPKQRSEAATGLISKVFLTVAKVIKPILRPLAPIGRWLKIILSWLLPRYFINAWREVRQVTWPNRRETWRLTGAVFVFAVVFGGLVAAVDKGLDELFKKVILK
ncbi:MAG TPA: preprotein translocase subunit SecE [Candidatus Saccharimonadales bacterium]|nr:preprotein translocase subunit SecE [Candidatus Saccharimonadales bacterium]